MIEWQELLAAFALVMVLEGLLPFAVPRLARLSYFRAAQLPEAVLRRVGAGSMAAGLLLLWLVR